MDTAYALTDIYLNARDPMIPPATTQQIQFAMDEMAEARLYLDSVIANR